MTTAPKLVPSAEKAPDATTPRPIPYLAAARKDLLPPPVAFTRSVLRYFRPGYHPTQEGSTQRAVAYLAVSPAARAAR